MRAKQIKLKFPQLLQLNFALSECQATCTAQN